MESDGFRVMHPVFRRYWWTSLNGKGISFFYKGVRAIGDIKIGKCPRWMYGMLRYGMIWYLFVRWNSFNSSSVIVLRLVTTFLILPTFKPCSTLSATTITSMTTFAPLLPVPIFQLHNYLFDIVHNGMSLTCLE